VRAGRERRGQVARNGPQRAGSFGVVRARVRRCLTGLVAAGLYEGHLLARQDVLHGLRWHGRDIKPVPFDRSVTLGEIPTVDAVHALARATADRTGV
jgi:hypothetical protein